MKVLFTVFLALTSSVAWSCPELEISTYACKSPEMSEPVLLFDLGIQNERLTGVFWEVEVPLNGTRVQATPFHEIQGQCLGNKIFVSEEKLGYSAALKLEVNGSDLVISGTSINEDCDRNERFECIGSVSTFVEPIHFTCSAKK
jgi:hypothetical protein